MSYLGNLSEFVLVGNHNFLNFSLSVHVPVGRAACSSVNPTSDILNQLVFEVLSLAVLDLLVEIRSLLLAEDSGIDDSCFHLDCYQVVEFEEDGDIVN